MARADFTTASYKPLPVKWYNQLLKNRETKPLNFDNLLKKARNRTGLKDLGSDFWDEPLSVLLQSINTEAALSPFGRFMMSEKLTGQLENRLWVTHWLKKYPEILEAEILPIYLITGLQRTGTTKLQRLLSQQQGARGLRSWEALYPAPIKTGDETKKRKDKTKMNARALKIISPGFFAIHPIKFDAPEEDVLLLDLHFMSTSMEAIARVPTYSTWLENTDQTPAYFFEKKLLKLLQWQKSGKYWVLKSPHHLEFIDDYKKVFPDAKMIWTHREIDKVVPSFINMIYHSRFVFSDDTSANEVRDHWMRKMQRMTVNGANYAEKHPGTFTHIEYDDFLKNEVDVLSGILGMEKNKINIRQKPYSSSHHYKLDDFDLSKEELENYFNRYLDFKQKLNSTKK